MVFSIELKNTVLLASLVNIPLTRQESRLHKTHWPFRCEATERSLLTATDAAA